MNQSEIRDRLLELARVRLKNRFGAFEQFRFTLDGLVEGSAILARASLLPAAWIAGFRLGLGEAAKQIDAHLLRIIDEWAQRESPARQIPALEGVQPLAAEPQAEAPSAAPVVANSAHKVQSTARRNLLTPAIEVAQRTCANQFDAPAVWAVLVQMAQDGKRPLVGVTEDGIKWNDAEDNPQFLTLKNLRDRLRQKKKKAL